MQLSELAEPLAYDTAFWLTAFEEPDGIELAELGRISVELCGKLRALGIIGLLIRGESDRFLHDLVRSGRVRESFLARLQLAGHQDDHHLAAGRVEALLDAIAAGDEELARRIAWLSPRSFEPAREYEDDFCYAQILHRIVHGVQATEVFAPLFDRFASALQGQPSPRLTVTRALVARSQMDFDAAFDALLQERKAGIQADIARAQIEDAQVLAEREVFVEGLALLRMAGNAGLVTASDYLYVRRLPGCQCAGRCRRRRRGPDMPHPSLTNKTAFVVEPLLLTDEDGVAQFVPCVQGTYDIGAQGETRLAEQQTPIAIGGRWRGDPATTSLIDEPQVAFVKLSTDVVLLGHAHAAGLRRTDGLVGVRLGPVQKTARVFGDRRFVSSQGAVRISAPQPFEQIPITYERAFGGWDERHADPAGHRCEPRNPVGVGSTQLHPIRRRHCRISKTRST